MAKKATFDLEGCEARIRSACASELTQKDWCEIWARAKSDAKRGKIGMLAALLPIVARKMPEEKNAGAPINPGLPLTAAERKELEGYGHQANA